MSTQREKCFADTLDQVLVTVEMITNRIDGLVNEKEIDRKYIKDNLECAFYDLEINLALLAISLRKMSENHYIKLSAQMRFDLNALIHSSNFYYREGKLYATSERGNEEINISKILDFAKEVIDQKE